MALGNLPVPGRPTVCMIVGQGPSALAVGAGGSYLDIFTLIYPFSPLSPSLWETARYRPKYCLKGPFNPKQPTNHPTNPPHTKYVYLYTGAQCQNYNKRDLHQKGPPWNKQLCCINYSGLNNENV